MGPDWENSPNWRKIRWNQRVPHYTWTTGVTKRTLQTFPGPLDLDFLPIFVDHRMLEARIHKLSQDILGFAVDAWNRCLESDSATERSPLGIPKELSCELQELLTNLREDAEGSVQSGIRNASPNPNTKVASAEHVREGLRPSPTEEELPLLLWASQALAQIEKLGAHRKELAPLKHSLHRTISLLSSCRSVRGAIEASSTRQAYELAYGLTHEINNPLGNIVARAQQLLTKATDDHARKSLATIVDQAMRAHEMLAEVMRAVQPRSVVRSQIGRAHV